MLSFKGDHNEEIIHFPNGMCVKIDFGNKEHDDFGHFYSCRNHEHRRIRLFDENNNFLGSLNISDEKYESRVIENSREEEARLIR